MLILPDLLRLCIVVMQKLCLLNDAFSQLAGYNLFGRKKNSCSRFKVHFEISGVASFYDASADI